MPSGVRGFRTDAYAVADLLAENAFIDMSLRIGKGRSDADKKRVGETIFATVSAFLSERFETPHFMLSLEIREIDAELSWKKNAIHPSFARKRSDLFIPTDIASRPEKARAIFMENIMSTFQDNLAKAEAYLRKFQGGVKNRIGGEDCDALDGSSFETISPVDLKVLAKVAQGKAADIDLAARAAKDAFAEWAAMPGEARKKLLHKIADAIVARSEEIAFVECMDTGQSLKFMAKAALRGAENFRFFADRAPEARMAGPCARRARSI